MSEQERKQPKLFPKLFCGDAASAFKVYIKKHKYDYEINYISDREDLLSLIEKYSSYRNYNLPVIISDISFLSPKDQSLLLKFLDDTKLNIILLASRDNILETIISRVKQFRKYYNINTGDKVGFLSASKAREMFNNECGNRDSDSSFEDKLLVYNKYNPVLAYDNYLVRSFNSNDSVKLLNILEYSND